MPITSPKYCAYKTKFLHHSIYPQSWQFACPHRKLRMYSKKNDSLIHSKIYSRDNLHLEKDPSLPCLEKEPLEDWRFRTILVIHRMDFACGKYNTCLWNAWQS